MRRNKRSVTVAMFLALLLVLLTACQTTENDPVTDETTEAAEVDQTEAAATEEDSEASEQGMSYLLHRAVMKEKQKALADR